MFVSLPSLLLLPTPRTYSLFTLKINHSSMILNF
jgi:hypothetical protein